MQIPLRTRKLNQDEVIKEDVRRCRNYKIWEIASAQVWIFEQRRIELENEIQGKIKTCAVARQRCRSLSRELSKAEGATGKSKSRKKESIQFDLTYRK